MNIERLKGVLESRAKWLPLVAYNTLFWVAFWLFCYWTFPYERVATHLTDRIAASGKGYSLEIGELDPYWISGVELTNVVLRKDAPTLAPAAPAAKTEGKPAADGALRIREARARVGLFGLLFGSKKLHFDLELEGGEIDGSYEGEDDTHALVARLDKIDLSKLSFLESVTQVPVTGTLSGDIDVRISKDPKLSEGEVKLSLERLVVGDGKAKVKVGGMGGLTLDPIEAGNLSIDLEIRNGIGTLRKLTTDGKDLVLKGSGEVRLGSPVSSSRLSVLLNIKFTDAYRQKSPRTQAMFGLLDSSSSPQIAAAKTADGALQYRLSGTFSSLRPLPEGSGRPAMPRSMPRTATPLPPPADDEAE